MVGRDKVMVSKEHKKVILHEKLQLLRSVTHSRAENEMSIIADASTYIKDLEQKIANLNQEIASIEDVNNSPLVSVETLISGFLINVFADTSNPGLLASILEAIEYLGITVFEARASCTGFFRLAAVGEADDEGLINAYAVKQAVVQAIMNCP